MKRCMLEALRTQLLFEKFCLIRLGFKASKGVAKV